MRLTDTNLIKHHPFVDYHPRYPYELYDAIVADGNGLDKYRNRFFLVYAFYNSEISCSRKDIIIAFNDGASSDLLEVANTVIDDRRMFLISGEYLNRFFLNYINEHVKFEGRLEKYMFETVIVDIKEDGYIDNYIKKRKLLTNETY